MTNMKLDMDKKIDMDKYYIYDAIWKNMDRENNLINYRNQWAILLSGGVLATSGAFLSASVKLFDGTHDLIVAIMMFVLFSLSCLAIYFCIRSQQGVKAAQDQIDYLLHRYDQFRVGSNNELEEMGLPRPFGDRRSHRDGNIAALTFPKVMVVFWIFFASFELVAGIFYFDRWSGLSASASQQSAPDKH